MDQCLPLAIEYLEIQVVGQKIEEMSDWYEVILVFSEPISDLFLIVFGGVFVSAFGPHIRRWIRDTRKNDNEKQREAKEKLEGLIAESESALSNNETSKQTRLKTIIAVLRFELANLRLIRNFIGVILFALAIAILVGALRMTNAWFDEMLEESTKLQHESILRLARSHIQWVDELQKEMLYMRTVQSADKPTALPGGGQTKGERAEFLHEKLKWNEEQRSKLLREELCRLRSYVAGENNAGDDRQRIWVASSTYRACMLEKGWMVKPCSPEEENCTELIYFDTKCTSITRRWVKNGGDSYDVKRCLVPTLQERLQAEGF